MKSAKPLRPFDRFTSIRAKLGATIVVAVAVTLLLLYVMLALTLPGSVIVSDAEPRGIWKNTAAFLGEAGWLLLAAGGLAAATALIFVRLLARGMTKPLRDMEAATSRMARGDYSERVHASSSDEVGRLATAFNQMAAELQRVDQLRRDLVANVSHELATPIAAIRAHLENLLEGLEQPDRATLDVMLRQSERLSSLVTQVLDLSRLESGIVAMDCEPVSIAALVGQVVAEVRIAHGGSGVRIDSKIPPDLPAALADRQRVHQVLYNLLDNAARLTPAGASVVADASVQAGLLEIVIDDEGPGIAQDQIPLVFERFYRADAARARSGAGLAAGGGGAGLGLAIARSIVEAHGGSIGAQRRTPTGMRFSFTLPAVPRSFGGSPAQEPARRRTVGALPTKENQ